MLMHMYVHIGNARDIPVFDVMQQHIGEEEKTTCMLTNMCMSNEEGTQCNVGLFPGKLHSSTPFKSKSTLKFWEELPTKLKNVFQT